MSKLNIVGIINNIKSKTNVYTPIVEAVVNSIESIQEANNSKGTIIILVKRENVLPLGDSLAPIKSLEIQDNGIGFTQKNRDSFDTFYSEVKQSLGGKGFGRFMFLKYFKEVYVESVYKNEKQFYIRKFNFGKKYDIIVNENNDPIDTKELNTKVFLNGLIDDKQLDKGLETFARKLLEKLLIFFINEKFNCPQIIIKEEDNSNQIILNQYISQTNEIKLVGNKLFKVKGPFSQKESEFQVKVFKVYFPGTLKSKISLTAHNREVTESALHNYVPEFEDDFFDEERKGNEVVRKNFIIKTYVLGEYLNSSVSLERETFNFDKDKGNPLYEFSQNDIEKEAAEITKKIFNEDVKVRADKKRKNVNEYVNSQAPWHKSFVNDLDFSSIPFNASEERIEIELSKIKFHKEQETKKEIKKIITSEGKQDSQMLNQFISKITDIGKSDLAHYVCNRKIILDAFQDLMRRNENGNAELEKTIHNLIFPMGQDSSRVCYEDHNLWLLDERLVFSEYIASDKKIAKAKRKKALGEPDLVIFDQKKSFRSGDNEFSNPLTIFEFKRPKRENYKQEDDPIMQVGKYLGDIRAGKYETPEGVEKIKVNENTPVYGYVICDLTSKIREFALMHQLMESPDDEGYFGYHKGYKMYVEIISFKKLLKDANLRNKIFFKKLHLE